MGRNTVQRQIILTGLQKLNSHPTIDEVYAEVSKEHPSISKTTVYRNLRQLANDGMIRQVLLPDGLERYDGTTVEHHHFNCTKCNGILDLEIDVLDDIDDKVQKKYGFRVERHDLVFSGLCLNCKE
ncbi:MAG: transcriptional repressor [Treponema sp.]|nr:transcriptional repressor [Treponema sp.]